MKKVLTFVFLLFILTNQKGSGQCLLSTIVANTIVPCSTSLKEVKIDYIPITGITGSVHVQVGSGSHKCFEQCVLLPPCTTVPCSTLVVYTNCYTPCAGIDTTFLNVYPTAICSTCVILPISFISFSAAKQNGGVLLKWKVATSSIRPGEKFQIEKSTDGVNFSNIGYIPIDQNQDFYIFNDNNLVVVNGKVFYRISFEGKYSPIAGIDVKGANISCSEFGNYMCVINAPANSQVQIYDKDGRRVVSTSNSIYIGSLKTGIYILTVVSSIGEKLFTKEFFKR